MEKKEEKILSHLWLKIYYFGLEGDVYSFLDNLANMLSSGIGILEALSEIKNGFFKGRMKKAVDLIYLDISEGKAFAEALDARHFLDDYLVSIIRLGEIAGELPLILKFVTTFQERENVFRSKVNSALLYATIIFAVTILVGSFTSLYTLPKIINMYGEFGQNPPALTKAVVGLGGFLVEYGVFLAPVFLGMIFAAFYYQLRGMGEKPPPLGGDFSLTL